MRARIETTAVHEDVQCNSDGQLIIEVDQTASGTFTVEDVAYDSGTTSNKTTEQDPITDKHVEGKLAETAKGTATTYPVYLDMDGFVGAGAQVKITQGSATAFAVTLEGTTQDDGTAQASCDYDDITELFDVVSWDADFVLIDGQRELGFFKFVRFKFAVTNAGNDSAWTIYHKKQAV